MKSRKEEKILDNVRAENNAKGFSLYLTGNVGRNYIDANKIRVALQECKGDKIDLHINSPGGDAFEAMAIYNYLTQSGKEIHVYVDGIAASAGSLIAMAGSKIFMPENTFMFIHHAWTFTAGNAGALQKTAAELEKVDEAQKKVYKDRFVGTQEELEILLNDEISLTANECKDLGFCDEVLTVGAVKAQAATDTEKILSKYIKNFEAKKPERDAVKQQVMAQGAEMFQSFFEVLGKIEGEN